MTTPPTLEQLLHRIANGDKSAIEPLYRAMERPIFRFVQSKLNDPFQSADILHDVFLEVWRSAAKFEGRSSARTWIFGIAYRKVMDVYRKANRTIVSDEMPEREDESPDALQCLAATEESTMLRDCLATLSPEHRAAIELTFFEDMGYRDIAAVTQVPEGTVKTRVFHAKKLLLHCLGQRMKPGMM